MKPIRQSFTPPSRKCIPSLQDFMWRRCNLMFFPYFFIQLFILVLTFHARHLSSSQWQLLRQATQLVQVFSRFLLCFVVSSTCLFPAWYFSQVVSYKEGLPFIQTWLQGPNLCLTQKISSECLRTLGLVHLTAHVLLKTNQKFPLRIYSKQLILLLCTLKKDERILENFP